ncbi:hypothetical protein A3C86_03410 [Candidatus Kaiserbacteria bacterium RIFCSPHIGHO2_02_FULL_49_16]|uniref:Response regulatory domain-containing protein n=1 Tax=Candidatus Kaiserbacteria bacterium RIFCSPHIGHO2_02_FULL_49_16 TaxID=1798490 RepID=A0A1F6DHV4_9BACT|nr:MAG: hypothetical protein A3C86_03410 [Candidatus Kaiserbacteria bacterium RIFCSPHIGHO2_02_FULL_49_16]
MKTPLRILVAEDGLNLQKALEAVLTAEGHVVRVVEHGGLALGLLKAGESYDLLITDQSMPCMKGLELVEEIRHDPNLCGLPAVVFTTDDYQEFVDRVRSLDAFHAAKPSLDELKRAIEEALAWGDKRNAK